MSGYREGIEAAAKWFEDSAEEADKQLMQVTARKYRCYADAIRALPTPASAGEAVAWRVNGAGDPRRLRGIYDTLDTANDIALPEYGDTIIPLYEAAPQSSPGFVSVPVEPTEDMIASGSEASMQTDGHCTSIYRAMLSASPGNASPSGAESTGPESAAAPAWVSVEERLPKRDETVLVWSDTHDFLGPTIGHCESHADGDGNWWHLESDEWMDSTRNVTHWMPLPAAPSAKEGK